jgi:hypothetical protein
MAGARRFGKGLSGVLVIGAEEVRFETLFKSQEVGDDVGIGAEGRCGPTQFGGEVFRVGCGDWTPKIIQRFRKGCAEDVCLFPTCSGEDSIQYG